MYYYDPDNKSPRRWAMIATAVYGVLLAGSFALVSFDFSPVTDKPGDTILVDFTEPPVPEPPRPPVKVANEPRVHDVAAPVEQTAQVAGKDPVTQTPNPKALFKMNKGGADEPDNAGNPRAPEGEDKEPVDTYYIGTTTVTKDGTTIRFAVITAAAKAEQTPGGGERDRKSVV